MDNKKTTELIHLTYEGNFELQCDAKVLCCRFIDGEKAVQVKLDRTTMHPQGGGQPTDIGIMRNDAATVQISKVTIDRTTGVVTHHGTGGLFHKGDTVKVFVDTDQRRILSECHTAGHVVDSAMARCDKMLPPSKGYHFLDGPYVEYKGSIPVEGREELLKRLQLAFQDLVDEDIPTKIEMLSQEEADCRCNRLQQNFNLSDFSQGDDDAPLRIVTVANWPCPCGGTHVARTADLKDRGWGILGIKSKKGVVRVRYGPISND